ALRRKQPTLNTGAHGAVFGEHARIDLVESISVAYVRQEHRHLHDIVDGGARQREGLLQVLERKLCLSDKALGPTSIWVKRDLPGKEKEGSSCLDDIGVQFGIPPGMAQDL